MKVFSAHVAHDLDAKRLNYQPKEWCKADGVYPRKKKQYFLSVLVAQMAYNQLPRCTFSTTEWLQWWAFAPVPNHILQDFGPEMGAGICPIVGLYPELYSTNFRSEYCRPYFLSVTD